MDTRTRSGRVSKPPVRYEPVEVVEDDYADDDYDEDESDVSSKISYDSEEEDDDDASSINEFVVEDSSDSDKSEDEEKPRNGRKPVQKRPASAPGAIRAAPGPATPA